MLPVNVEVITPLPEGWGICVTCEMLIADADIDKPPHERGLDEYPAEWQEEFQRFSDLVLDLSARYDDTVLIRIFDPRSLQGLWKSIRYGVRRYPTFIINGKKKVAGWDVNQIDTALQAAGAHSQLAIPHTQ